VQLLNGLITAALFGSVVYFLVTLNQIANMSGDAGKRTLKSALLFLVVIPSVAGFITGFYGMTNKTAVGLYIGYFAYISGIAGVFYLAKGLKQAFNEAAKVKERKAEEA